MLFENIIAHQYCPCNVRQVCHYNSGTSAVVVDNRYTYDPFGNPFTAEIEEGISNPYRFANYIWDGVIQQYFCNARWYDPALARFTGRDPVLGDFQEPLTLHAYLYCLNNPVNAFDPSGETMIGTVLAVAMWAGEVAVDIGVACQMTGMTAAVVGALNYLGGATAIAMMQMFDSWDSGTLQAALQAQSVGMDLMQAGIAMTFGGFALQTMGTALATGASLMAASYGGTANNAAGNVGFTQGQLAQFQRQLAQDGINSLLKSRATLERRLWEHMEKLSSLEYKSSVEREINNFQQQINAIDEILRNIK